MIVPTQGRVETVGLGHDLAREDMALRKSELYSSLWSSCDELRGGMDASQYKDYVLVLLFIKYVSDKYAGQPYAPIAIPPGAGFKDMVALKGKPDIGDQINKKIIAPLANANKLSDFPDFNDATKLGIRGRSVADDTPEPLRHDPALRAIYNNLKAAAITATLASRAAEHRRRTRSRAIRFWISPSKSTRPSGGSSRTTSAGISPERTSSRQRCCRS